MIYHFDSLESLAAYLENFAKQARANAARLKTATGSGKVERERKIASYNSEAYGYEQSADVIRKSVIKPDAGASVAVFDKH